MRCFVKMKAIYLIRVATVVVIVFAIYAYFNRLPGKFYFTRFDELMHITGFTVISFVVKLSFPSSSSIMLIFWLCMAGLLVEVMQPLLTVGRELSCYDVMANWVGVSLGVMIVATIIRLISIMKSPLR